MPTKIPLFAVAGALLALSGCSSGGSNGAETTPESEVPQQEQNQANEELAFGLDFRVEAEQAVEERAEVTLSVVLIDADAGDLTYRWVQQEGPEVELQSVNAATTKFTAPEVNFSQEVSFTVTVANSAGDSVARNVSITVEDNNTEIGLRDHEWQNPMPLDERSGANFKPLTAINAKGQAVVVWSQKEGDRGAVRLRRVDTTTDTVGEIIEISPEHLSSDMIHHNYKYYRDVQKAVAIDAEGQILVVFKAAASDGSEGLYLRYITDQASTEDTDTAVIKIADDAAFPKIVQADDGSFFISWLKNQHLWLWEFDPSFSEVNPAQLSTQPVDVRSLNDSDDGPYYETSVHGQRIHAVWASAGEVQYRALDQGVLSDTVTLSSMGPATNPQVASSSSGRVAVTWLQSDGNDVSVYGSAFDGSWSDAKLLENFGTAPTGPADMIFDSSERAHVLFPLRTGSYSELVHASWSNDGWNEAQIIYDLGAVQPELAADGHGNVATVFYNHHTQYMQYSGADWSYTTHLSPYNDGISNSLSINERGVGIAAWIDKGDNNAHFAVLK